MNRDEQLEQYHLHLDARAARHAAEAAKAARRARLAVGWAVAFFVVAVAAQLAKLVLP